MTRIISWPQKSTKTTRVSFCEFCAFLWLFFNCASAAPTDQIICSLGPKISSYNAYSDQRPSSDAMQLAMPVNAAMAAVCRPNCPRVSLFRNPTASNAMLIGSSGQSRIVYNPEFFTKIYDAYGDSGIETILAHELGHAIDATTQVAWMKRQWTTELRADAWTGCALAKLNFNSRGLGAAVDVLAKYPPPSEPDWTP